jgi:hypothetical protein
VLSLHDTKQALLQLYLRVPRYHGGAAKEDRRQRLMPGSFWLNPPHARDDQNTSVDSVEVMLQYEREAVVVNNNDLQDEGNVVQSQDSNDSEADMPDDELARILADMD